MNYDSGNNAKDKKFESWFRQHYIIIILILLSIFLFLPILAPILIKIGFFSPAKLIYWVYSFFCHQLPFRSFFLFGHQPFYPLESAGIKGYLSFETVFNPVANDFDSFRNIIGTSFSGYKIAICQRDLAMYLFLLIFGIIFSISKMQIKKIPLWIWFIFGVLPLGIDGIIQLGSNSSLSFLAGIRWESTPYLRTITGALFGFFTGWYIFPTIELLFNHKSPEKLI